MGSSGGTQNYKQPNIPAPPANMVAGYGGSVPFQPNFVNFLGDPNVPSTGLTPAMLQQIDSGAYAKPVVGNSGMGGGGIDPLLAQIMARLDEMQKPTQSFAPQQRWRGAQRNSGGR